MKPLTNKFVLILLACFLPAVFMASCSSDDDPVIPDPPSLIQLNGTVGITGGTLTSSDGQLTMTIPAGALAADTDISITEITPDEAPAVFQGLLIEKAFNVEPLGLEFAADVEITLTLDLDPPAVNKSAIENQQVQIEARFIAVQDSEIDHPRFLDTNIEVANERMMVASLRQLNIFILGALGSPALWVESQLAIEEQVFQFISFESTLTTVISNLLIMGTGPQLYYSANSFIFEVEEGEELIPETETTESDGSTTLTYNIQSRTSDFGSLNMDLSLSYNVTPDREAFAHMDLPESLEMPVIRLLIDLPTLPVTVAEDEPASDDLPIGVYFTGMGLSEGMSVFRGFAGWELDNTVAVSSGDGMSFLNLNSDPPLQVANDDFSFPGHELYGTLTMKMSFKSSEDAGYQILLFGPNGGSISNWDSVNHGFGMQQLFAFNQNLTDALPYDNNPMSSGYCYVNNTQNTVQLLEYNSDTGFFQNAGTVSGFQGADGNAVSAYVREGESLLSVVDGTPGKLYLQQTSSIYDTPEYIADVGNSPRRIRSLNNVAVVSNFASGTLTIVSWSQADEVAINETVAVGDGPVGIDLLELPGGNIAIASTGFNDNTYWVTIVSSSGSLVSNQEYSLPAGITGAGHAMWAHDADNRILVSGNTSGNMAVVSSGL
jgi:hypothetical protein